MKNLNSKFIINVFYIFIATSFAVYFYNFSVFSYYKYNYKIGQTETGEYVILKNSKIVKCGTKSTFKNLTQSGEKMYFSENINSHENLFACNLHTKKVSRITDNFKSRFVKIIPKNHSNWYSDELKIVIYN